MTRILFFGRMSEAAGCSELDAELPSELRTVAALRSWLADRDAALKQLILSPGIRAAVDRGFCGDDASIVGAQEIAFMSPLSGG
ncbi:MAG: MoaD/ThiS family protein [Proteobacteria bacterium]|nr:MoaD/ThiS family protein [Pseudomonadota bacterium]